MTLLASLIIVTLYFIFEPHPYDNKTIKFGVSLPKSGIMHSWGNSVYVGANAYFSYAKDNNILNKKISLIVYDDKYAPELTFENTKKMIKKDIFSFFGFVGTPTTKKIMPLVNKYNIPLIAPFTGASFLRNTENKNIVNFRASYKEEIDAIVQYLYIQKGIKKISVFYQNDDYGHEGYVSLLQVLKEHNLTLQGEGTYKRNTLSIQHAFREIKHSKPEAIIMVGAHQANSLFIKTARKYPSFSNTIFCNISFGNADAMVKTLNYQTKNLLFSQVVPNYKTNQKPVIKEYRQIMKKYAPEQKLEFISLESFLVAKIITTALNKITGILTREKFLQILRNLPKDTLDGINLDFKNNQLYHRVYLFKYENSNFIEVENEH